jgi:hypothetical protein
MKKCIANKTQYLWRRRFHLVLALVIGIFVDEQTRAQSRSSVKSEQTSEQSQAELDAISVRNALAQPSGEKSTVSSPGRMQIQTRSDVLPTSATNNMILEMIDRMPTGGDYRASSDSIHKLEFAIQKEEDHLVIDPAVAKPSFCSSATYLVFVWTLEELNRRKQIQFAPGIPEKLLVTGQHDGVGVWGRWNANGPGTARLFAELHLGYNFDSIEQAERGDFLKIFWNDQIGSKEFGHSVIYLWHGLNSEGVEVVQYWSSNKKGGYGRAEVPRSKIKRMLFSRLEYPERINQIGDGLKPDEYLASMLIRSSSPEEMDKMVGIIAAPGANPVSGSGVDKDKENKTNAVDSIGDQKNKNEYQTTP